MRSSISAFVAYVLLLLTLFLVFAVGSPVDWRIP